MAPSGQLAGQLEADDAGDEHRHGLAEHGRLGLDAADAPAEDAQAVDHRGVGVGAHAGVGVGDDLVALLAREDHAGQVLDVDLVHDAGARRDDLEVAERALAPAQELVALAVALVLDLDVALEGLRRAEDVGDHGVVDDQLGRGERVDLLRVAAEVGHGLAHRGEVDDARDAGEVLHDHAGRGELDLLVGLGRRVPVRDRPDVVGGDVRAVLGAQQVLQEDLQAEGQLVGALHRVEPEDVVVGAVDGERRSCSEAVLAGCHSSAPTPRWFVALVSPPPIIPVQPREHRVRHPFLHPVTSITPRKRRAGLANSAVTPAPPG